MGGLALDTARVAGPHKPIACEVALSRSIAGESEKHALHLEYISKQSIKSVSI